MSQRHFIRLLTVTSVFLLSACGADPSGDVAYVTSRDESASGGVVRFEVRKKMREQAERDGFTLYARISVHPLGAKALNCFEMRATQVNRSLSKEEERLSENGWVAVKDRTGVVYRMSGDLVFVRVIGGGREIRCQRPTSERPMRVHVHFLGRPMPFGSSDEGMLGLDVFIPQHAVLPGRPASLRSQQ